MTTVDAQPLRLEPWGRLLQQSWLDDVVAGGPLRFADWLAALPDDLGAPAPWRLDLVVAERLSRSAGASLVVEPEPGGRCLDAGAVALVEAVLADLRSREMPFGEAVALLDAAVDELAGAAQWPVPAEARGRLERLAALLVDALAATGAEIRGIELLVGVPAEGGAPEGADVLDLERVAAACLAVPRAVLASVGKDQS